jgi:CRISPR-associated protein Cmr6
MSEKPILKSKPQNSGGNEPRQSPPAPPRSLSQKPTPPKSSLNIEAGDAKNVPLMFQAQIKDRGNIQYVGDKKDKSKSSDPKPKQKPKYEQWVDEWIKECPTKLSKPLPNNNGVRLSEWQKQLAQLVPDKLPESDTDESPESDTDVKIWEYKIRWRIVMNGGQDEGVIRPVFGAKGMPFFPGSSMKGAFRRVCPEAKLQRYCGTLKDEKPTRPGILRFHGGYPTDMAWAQSNRLVDIAHGQQSYQVMRSEKNEGENANVQISLYQPKIEFEISSSQSLEDAEWLEIKKIWEKALGHGIGSRVSAGYGYVEEVEPELERVLLSVHLNGQGLMSQLLENAAKFKTPEFRPNMFKAALRGHTLRLLGGITDEDSAKALARQIWGGIPEQGNETAAVVGRIGIHFVEGNLSQGEHIYHEMPTYRLEGGKLDLLQIGIGEVSPELKVFLQKLVQFSLLLGGFGKSWRRVHHGVFYPSYFKDEKPMIGCHWEFAEKSKGLYIADEPDLTKVSDFIETVRGSAIAWVKSESNSWRTDTYVGTWREAWHSSKVQVWGRVATNKESLAVRWFHDSKRLKGTDLAGRMGQIGRVWHRIYPSGNGYIELLTMFPDDLDQTKNFLSFLKGETDFELLWGDADKS